MHIKNCTNETLRIGIAPDQFLTLPPAEKPTIVKYQYQEHGQRLIDAGRPHQCYQLPIRLETAVTVNLPDPESGILCLVDPHVLAVVPSERTDVFTYSDEKDDGNGRVILDFLIARDEEVSAAEWKHERFAFLQSADALQAHLEAIIAVLPASRAEYTTLPKDAFCDSEFEQLLNLLETLATRKTIGYRIEKACVRVVLKMRMGGTKNAESP